MRKNLRKGWRALCMMVMLAAMPMNSMAAPRWDIAGHHAVQWNNLRGGVPHSDHIEMSGEQVACVYYWSVDNREEWHVNRHLIFPSLRTVPDNTHASWMPWCDVDFLQGMTANGNVMGQEHVKWVKLDGVMQSMSIANGDYNDFELTRTYWTSVLLPMVCEQYTFKNIGERTETLLVPARHIAYTTNHENGTRGSYRLVARTEFNEDLKVTIKPGESTTFYCTIQAYAVRGEKELTADCAVELRRRQQFVEEVTSKLDFECPNDTLNTLFALSKIRGAESINKTPNGPMHAPGGESYYAAMWCNDQAEYINPFFPFLGYKLGNESAMTTWRSYLKFINPEYKYVPWSIICGGNDTFGRFDRGDAAMLAYGASRYCLERGDKVIAEEIWPLVEWCLEYSHRKLNKDGVVASDADELEGRLPAGDANLCTSSLYYDALLSAAYLSEQLGHDKTEAATYRAQAATLRQNIDKFFHVTVEGYDTYRYYNGNDKLRSWICIPLTMGIYERAEGTLKAMFSPRLWTENGMLSVSGDNIFWDRSTLYGLRGAFAAGRADTALEFMQKYSAIRLLGEHVPYVVEAWPEGGQRHLSAENGLYCRIITEGLLGFRPTGFRNFTLTPQMPKGWNKYTLRNIYACSASPFDIEVVRKGCKVQITVLHDKKVYKRYTTGIGQTVAVSLPQWEEVATAHNPVFTGWYADPEGAYMGGKYWIFPTYSAAYKEQLHFDAFSSTDLINWTKHERVLEQKNIPWLWQALWAPSIIEANGKYYLFFGGNDVHEGEVGGIGVAVADKPEGPYKDALGKPLINEIVNGAQPIDQFVFRDDDGQYYMFYGGWRHCNVCKLSSDLLSIVPWEDGQKFHEITPSQSYVEGPFMLKRNGKYYFMWSEGGWTGPDYCVAYAISDSPFGPFKRIGKILQQDPAIATGAGHHSVIQVPGRDEYYIVYHRRPLTETNGNSRETCIDRLEFNEDGTIKPVVMTNEREVK